MTVGVGLEHTSDAIDLVSFLERQGLEAQLVPLPGRALEVTFDARIEEVVRRWLAEHDLVARG